MYQYRLLKVVVYMWGVTLWVLLSFCVSVNAFEPVSIDDFFKKYPDERPVQPTMPIKNKKNTPIILPTKDKNAGASSDASADSKKEEEFSQVPDVAMEITARTYPKAEILLIDRILGRSETIKVTVNKKTPLNSLFDVTVFECLERKNQFHNVTQIVAMRIDGYANSKKDTQKTILYNDIFYIQMPGFKGFEHPIYDIKPIKCLGKPQAITALSQEATIPEPQVPSKVQEETKTPTPVTKEKAKEEVNLAPKNNLVAEEKDLDAIADIINNDTQKNSQDLTKPSDDSMPISVETPLAVPFAVE